MAIINAEQLPDDITDTEFKHWLVTQSDAIRQSGIRYPPNYLFLFNPTQQHVCVTGYNRNGTLNVEIVEEFNNTLSPPSHKRIAPNSLIASYPPNGKAKVL